MNKIKTFIRTFVLSFTDPNYYNDVVRAKFNFSIKYFLVFYTLLSFIFAVYSWFLVKNEVSPRIDDTVEQVVDMYPEDLIVSYDGESNTLSTSGVEEPVIIEIFENDYIQTDIKNLLVIDTDAAAEDISTYNSLILLTDSHVAAVSDRLGGFQVLSFVEIIEALNENESGRKITQINLDKTFLISNTPSVKMMLHKTANMLPVLVFFGSVIGFVVGRLILLLILSVLNSIMAMILGKKLTYVKVYQLGLHTITVAEGITKISSLVFRNSATSLFSFAFLGISFIALLGIKTNQEK